MRPSTAARVAGLLSIALVVILGLGWWLSVLSQPRALRTDPLAFFENIWLLVVFGLYGWVGAFVAARQPGNRIGWLLLAVGLLVGAAYLAEQYGLFALLTLPGRLPGGLLALWLATLAWMLGISLVFTFLLLLFPTGRLPSARWRPVAWLAGGATVAALVYFAFSPFGNEEYPELENPFGVPALADMPGLDAALVLLLALLGLASVASLFVRFRAAVPDERQQLKWFLYAAGILALGTGLEAAGRWVEPLAPVAYVLLDVGYAALPLALGLAILRYRLWDIDLLIRRTLIYAALTASLALVYFGSVVVLQGLLRAGTGQAQGQLVIVLSTLTIAALFAPLRQRIQAFIDRRFYRRKYDAARAIAGFGASLRDDVHADLDQMRRRLLQVVEETVQPEHAGLWLREAPRSGSH